MSADSSRIDRLKVSPVVAAWLQSEHLELCGDVLHRNLMTTRPSFASFEEIVGKKRDVRFEALGAEVSIGRRSGDSCRQRQS